MDERTYVDGLLTLRLHETATAVRLDWVGMSVARDPARFVLPILSLALEAARKAAKPLEVDFQKMEYLNSSTITPLIRILEQARRGKEQVKVFYKKALKWQSLSFTALEVFRTSDQRIDVRGV